MISATLGVDTISAEKNPPILIHNRHVRIGQSPKELQARRVETLTDGLVKIWGVAGIRRNESPNLEANEDEVRKELLPAQQWPCVLTHWGWVDRRLFGISILFSEDFEWALLQPGGNGKWKIVRNEHGRLELVLDGASVGVSLVKEGKFVRLVYDCSKAQIGMGNWEDEESLEKTPPDLIIDYSQKGVDDPPIMAHISSSFASHLPGGALLLLGSSSGDGVAYFCSAAGRESLMKLIWPQQERRGGLLGLLFARRGA